MSSDSDARGDSVSILRDLCAGLSQDMVNSLVIMILKELSSKIKKNGSKEIKRLLMLLSALMKGKDSKNKVMLVIGNALTLNKQCNFRNLMYKIRREYSDNKSIIKSVEKILSLTKSEYNVPQTLTFNLHDDGGKRELQVEGKYHTQSLYNDGKTYKTDVSLDGHTRTYAVNNYDEKAGLVLRVKPGGKNKWYFAKWDDSKEKIILEKITEERLAEKDEDGKIRKKLLEMRNKTILKFSNPYVDDSKSDNVENEFQNEHDLVKQTVKQKPLVQGTQLSQEVPPETPVESKAEGRRISTSSINVQNTSTNIPILKFKNNGEDIKGIYLVGKEEYVKYDGDVATRWTSANINTTIGSRNIELPIGSFFYAIGRAFKTAFGGSTIHKYTHENVSSQLLGDDKEATVPSKNGGTTDAAPAERKQTDVPLFSHDI